MKRYPSLIIVFIVFILIILGYVFHTPLSIAGVDFQNLDLEGINVETRGQLGESCSVDGNCFSSYCSDGVCCDTACTGSTCQTCGALSSAGIGHCGYVNSSSQDPDNDCSPAACNDAPFLNSASGLSCDSVCASHAPLTGNCSGSGYTCDEGSACSCYGIGTTPAPTPNGYYADAGAYCSCAYTYSGTCSTPTMVSDGCTCTEPTLWTYCHCN